MIPLSSLDAQKIDSSPQSSTASTEDWYYLPSYANYCPQGMPDFDQRQDQTWGNDNMWTFCGPVALANIFWWFDSRHSDPQGFPGDGADEYALVQNLNIYNDPNPGPYADDHNFNNVNDLSTHWDSSDPGGELIEQIGKYVDIHWYQIPFFSLAGVDRFSLAHGARKWIADAGLKDQYTVENYFRPSFELIEEKVRDDCGIILRLGYHLSFFPSILFPIMAGHYVTVAGVGSNGHIVVSDPRWDISVPSTDPTLHNDPNFVSHDTYEIDDNPPYPILAKFWIPEFEVHRTALVIAATVISEV